jgi:Skp family chaperone for outer membrane proteins
MSTVTKAIALSALLLAGTAGPALAAKPAPAAAPAAASGTVGVNGIAVANLEGVIGNSTAFKTAQAQRPTIYKAQIDQAEARRAAIAAQLQPLVEKFNKDRAANAPQSSLQTQAQAIQQIQDSANQELQKILAPVSLSEAYVQEQINDKLGAAIQTAMSKNGVSLLLNPQAVLAVGKSYDLSMAILSELNTALPSAQLVPPAGWEPREVREQKAAQAAQQGQRGAGDGR